MLSFVLSAAAAVPDVDAPLRTGASAPGDAAVVVGVEDYAFLGDVPSAGRDARAMYHFFVYTRGLAPEKVALLQGGNREQVLAAVERAKGQLGPGGTLWITWAGHGATNPDDGGPLLVGDDAKPDPTVFVARSVKVRELPADAVLLLDTCWAGKGRDGAELVPGTRFAVPAFAAAPKGGALLTAAQPSQLSEPYPAADHGLFSYFFAGAARGWADGELDGAPDGQVTLREAQAYVGRAIATVHPSGQQPTFSGQDRVLVSAPGRLEAGPELAALPKVGAPARPASPVTGTPVLGGGLGTPTLGSGAPAWTGTPMVPMGKTWTGALSLVGRDVVEAPDGERLSLADAASLTVTDPAVARTWSRTQVDASYQRYGGALLATSVALGALYGGVIASSTDLGASTAIVFGGAGVPAALGGGMFVLGTAHKRRHREELVAAINAAE